MLYRINRNYAEKFNKKPFEGCHFKLRYDILGKETDSIRWGGAEDLDGIINILTEYGILEEVKDGI